MDDVKQSKFRVVNQCKVRTDIAAEIILFEFHYEATAPISDEAPSIIDVEYKSLLSHLKSHMETCPNCVELDDG